MRKEDWLSLKSHAMCGVPEKFSEVTMRDYDEDDALFYLTSIWDGSWFYAWGPVGTGKTHLLSALIRSFFIHGLSSYMVYVPVFLKQLKASFGNKEVNSEDLIHRLETVDLLALDDIGTEKRTDFNKETLTNIINTRYGKKLRTIVSSNYDLDELAKIYARLGDRIRENAEVLELAERRAERG